MQVVLNLFDGNGESSLVYVQKNLEYKEGNKNSFNFLGGQAIGTLSGISFFVLHVAIKIFRAEGLNLNLAESEFHLVGVFV